jgi:hypothetical protein
VRGLWLERGQGFFLDETGTVRRVGGNALYRIEEASASQDYIMWKDGARALLYGDGRYWLLSWPQGRGE